MKYSAHLFACEIVVPISQETYETRSERDESVSIHHENSDFTNRDV